MFSRKNRIPQFALCFSTFFGLVCLLNHSALAQGDATIGDLQNLQDQGTVDSGGTAVGTTAGSTAGAADGELETIEPVRLGLDIEDERNQGFVGPSAPLVQELGFVGPPSENNALGGVGEGRSLGGGVNEGLGGRSATASSAELQDNGFTVTRKSLRAKLVPAFAAPRTPDWVAESRFRSRLSRQPVVQNMGSGVTVTVKDRRAFVSGVFGSAAERDVIMRQLRLEPGVYGIVDQTSTIR